MMFIISALFEYKISMGGEVSHPNYQSIYESSISTASKQQWQRALTNQSSRRSRIKV